jgi:hypothetical protein
MQKTYPILFSLWIILAIYIQSSHTKYCEDAVMTITTTLPCSENFVKREVNDTFDWILDVDVSIKILFFILILRVYIIMGNLL